MASTIISPRTAGGQPHFSFNGMHADAAASIASALQVGPVPGSPLSRNTSSSQARSRAGDQLVALPAAGKRLPAGGGGPGRNVRSPPHGEHFASSTLPPAGWWLHSKAQCLHHPYALAGLRRSFCTTLRAGRSVITPQQADRARSGRSGSPPDTHPGYQPSAAGASAAAYPHRPAGPAMMSMPGAVVSPPARMPAGQGAASSPGAQPPAYMAGQGKFAWDADYHRTLLEAAQRLPAGAVPAGFIRALHDTMAPLAEAPPLEPDPAALKWFQETYPGIMSASRRDVLAVRAYLEAQMHELRKSLGLAAEGRTSANGASAGSPGPGPAGHGRQGASPERAREPAQAAASFMGADSVVLLRDGDGYVSTAVLKHQVGSQRGALAGCRRLGRCVLRDISVHSTDPNAHGLQIQKEDGIVLPRST